MIESRENENIRWFGKAAIDIIDGMFLNQFQKIIIYDPSFYDLDLSNISPQFDEGKFYAIALQKSDKDTENYEPSIKFFSLAPTEVELALDPYRYEHAIFATADLSIITAWAQAEYAVIGFHGGRLSEFSEWLEYMNSMGVAKRIPCE